MTREAILQALATRLSAIRAPQPREVDLDSVEKVTVIADGQEQVISREYGIALTSMTLGIYRARRAANEDTRSTEANALLEALIAETYGTDPTLGGTCLDIRYVEGSTEYPDDPVDFIGATAFFAAEYERPE